MEIQYTVVAYNGERYAEILKWPVTCTVFASSEAKAITEAQKLVKRDNYQVKEAGIVEWQREYTAAINRIAEILSKHLRPQIMVMEKPE